MTRVMRHTITGWTPTRSKERTYCLGLQFSILSNISLWTDPSIVLAWLKNEIPLQSYIANSIAWILDITVCCSVAQSSVQGQSCWSYYQKYTAIWSTLLSIWWNGSVWLLQDSNLWPGIPELPSSEIPEVRQLKLILAITHMNFCCWTNIPVVCNLYA